MHEIEQIDGKGLRDFGLLTGVMVAVLFGLFFPWLLGRPMPLWPWIVAGVLSLWGLLAPASMGPLYVGWMKLGLLLSKITTPIILGVVFLLLIIPMGLVMRLAGKDPMQRRFDGQAESYRIASHKIPRKSVERPY